MDSLKVKFLSFLYLVIYLSSLTNGQPEFTAHSCSNSLGTYSNNSIYQENLNRLLSSVVSTGPGEYGFEADYGFYTGSVGNSTNQVNAMALCRGDVSLDDCRSCLNDSTHRISQDCPNRKEAVGFYFFCMLLYSSRSLSGIIGGFSPFYVPNPNNVSDITTFNSALDSLMLRLQSSAASGNLYRKFATESHTAGSDTSYGLVQCTPTLSEKECTDCLSGIVRQIQTCCSGKEGGRVLLPSCNLRFELFRFYEVTDADTDSSVLPIAPSMLLSPPPPLEEKESKRKNRTIIIIVICTISTGIFMVCICIFLRLRKPKKNVESHATFQIDGTKSAEPYQFDFDTIRAATNDFSEENKLGQGGFGAVYKGTFYNKKDIAVKRLSTSSGQGNLEFKNEVLLVAKLQHKNLVKLLGFCLEGNERLLVYEFVPNGSLDHFIFDPVKRADLNWETRFKIIGGIARGLVYLHEDSRLRVIHRDLKWLQFSVKSDVFSFGVLVLEILIGQKNGSFRNGEIEHFLSCAWEYWREGTFLDLIDPTIRNSGSTTEMMRCFHIALLCVQENVTTRPTMASVVLMLSSHSLTLPVPSKPAFFMNSTSKLHINGPSKTGTEHPSKNDASVTISDLHPR